MRAATNAQTAQRDVRLIRLETELNNDNDNLTRLYRQENASLSDARLLAVVQANQYPNANPQALSADFAHFQLNMRAQHYQYLLIACRNGCPDVVQRLFKLGITPFCSDLQGRTPLHNAALSQSGEVVRSVTQARDLLESRCQKYWDGNHVTCILCSSIPKDITHVDDNGRTPVDLYLDLINTLLFAGKRVSGLNTCLQLLFLRAVRLGVQQEVTKVLNFFSDIHTAVINANQPGQIFGDILENRHQFVLNGHNGPDIEPAVHFIDTEEIFKDSALHIAARNGDHTLLGALLNSINPYDRERLVKKKNDCSGGETALTTAMFYLNWHVERKSETEDRRVDVGKVQDLLNCIALLRTAGAVITQDQDELLNWVNGLLTPQFINNPIVRAIFPRTETD